MYMQDSHKYLSWISLQHYINYWYKALNFRCLQETAIFLSGLYNIYMCDVMLEKERRAWNYLNPTHVRRSCETLCLDVSRRYSLFQNLHSFFGGSNPLLKTHPSLLRQPPPPPSPPLKKVFAVPFSSSPQLLQQHKKHQIRNSKN